MIKTIIIPAIYDGSRDLKDRTKKLTFTTNEVTPEQAANLQTCVQGFVFLAIKHEPFVKDELNIIDNLSSEFEPSGKSPAQRLRAVLYRNWEKDNKSYDDFNLYYEYHINKLIKYFKETL